jgi:hypothetical protein
LKKLKIEQSGYLKRPSFNETTASLMLLDSSFLDCVVFEKTSHTAVLSFRSRIKSGMTDPESTVFFIVMPLDAGSSPA